MYALTYRVARIVMVLLLVGLLVGSAFAHAILVESTPAANSTVSGPNVAVKLKFNVRIDAARSRLRLVLPTGATRSLPSTAGNFPNLLLANATGLTAGKYKIAWQVLASDGHITRGEIVFSTN